MTTNKKPIAKTNTKKTTAVEKNLTGKKPDEKKLVEKKPVVKTSTKKTVVKTTKKNTKPVAKKVSTKTSTPADLKGFLLE